MTNKQIKKQPIKNRGTAIIEITILIPIYLGVLYLYIISFLFLIESGFIFQSMLECIYNVETKSEIQQSNNGISEIQQGNLKIVRVSNTDKVFQIYLEIKGCADAPTEKIRRWQIAVDTIS